MKAQKKYSLFIGRWQPWHAGHRWLIDQQLEKGKNVCIAIRDMPKDKNNPYSPDEIMNNLNNQLRNLIENERVKVIIIPDIESINYGRGVGYEIIEHIPPKNIKEISATKIREKMNE